MYSNIFVFTFFLAIILTLIVRRIVIKLNIVDEPGERRKIHEVMAYFA